MKIRLPKDDNSNYNTRLKAAIMEAVDNQLTENNPPVAFETYQRLIDLGYTSNQAKEKIAAVLVEHIYYIMKDNKPFDEKWYEKQLNELI